MSEIRNALERVVDSSESPDDLAERVTAAYGEDYVSLARQIAAERKGFDWLRHGIPELARPSAPASAAGLTDKAEATAPASDVGPIDKADEQYFQTAKRVAKKGGLFVAVCFVIAWVGIDHFGELGFLKFVVMLAIIAVMLGAPVVAWYGIPVLVRSGRLHDSFAIEAGLVLAFAVLPIAWSIYQHPSEIHPTTILRVAEGSGAFVAKCFIASIAGYVVTRFIKPLAEWRRSQPYIGLAVASWWFSIQFSGGDPATASSAIVLSSWFGYFVGRITKNFPSLYD